jgi:hypothetical protein
MYGYGYRYNSGLVVGAGGGAPLVNTYSTQFDGVDDYVDCGVITTLQNASEYSLSCWFKTSDFTKNQGILKWYYALTGWIQVSLTGSTMYFVPASSSAFGFNSPAISNDTWYNIIMVFDGTGIGNSNRLKAYLNGVELVLTYSGTVQPTTTAMIGGTFKIGERYINTDYFLGNIDEVSIFDSVIAIGDVWDGSGAATDLSLLATPPTNWYRNGDNGSWKSPQWLIPNNENKDKVSNYSFDFDGVDDYITASNAVLSSAGDMTISCWANFTSLSSVQGIFDSTNYFLSGFNGGFSFRTIGANLDVAFSNGTSFDAHSATAGLSTSGGWYHLAFTFDNTTKVGTFYKNGASIGTHTYIGYDNADLTNGGVIARSVRNNNFCFTGLLDEIVIFDSVKDATAINDIYNGGTPTTISGAVAHYKMGEEANFTSNWLVDNSALTNYSKRSFDFDGVDDYISVSDNSIGQTQNISYSIWVNLDATTRQYIVGNWGSSNFGGGLSVENGDVLVFQMADGTNDSFFNSRVVGFSTHAPINTWNHILATWDGTDSKIYINGVLRNTWSPTLPYTISYSNTFWIGRRSNNDFSVNGKLDELALFNTAISIGDVWDGSGQPIDVSAVSGLTNNWRMGEEASFNGTNWTVPDNLGSNNGTSANMTVDSLVGEAANYSDGGISNGMTIEDRVGEAPNSTNNALSINMDLIDRVPDTPPTP